MKGTGRPRPSRVGATPSSRIGTQSIATHQTGRRIVYVGLAADALIALVKFVAAEKTGSSAMMSEAVHSVVDGLTGVLLLYGLIASKRKPNAEYKFGFGREVYFWNFVVALTILGFGGGASLFDGLRQLATPRPIEDPAVSFGVLAFAMPVEVASLWYSVRQSWPNSGLASLRRVAFSSSDATVLTILLDDAAALFGLVIAAAGTALSIILHEPMYDGIASIVKSVILAAIALVLVLNSKAFLIGRSASSSQIEAIITSAKSEVSLFLVNGVLTAYLAPDQLVVAMSIEFNRHLDTAAIEKTVVDIESRLRADHPIIYTVFIKPETPKQFRVC